MPPSMGLGPNLLLLCAGAGQISTPFLSATRSFARTRTPSHAEDHTELPKGVRDDPPEDPGPAKVIDVLRAKLKGSSSVRNDREP